MKSAESGLFLKSIKQLDNSSFAILWSNGQECRYRLSDLQQKCPCAQCTEARANGKVIQVSATAKAKRITSVGRYAIRVDFSTGCSNGIFDFDYLYGLGVALEPVGSQG